MEDFVTSFLNVSSMRTVAPLLWQGLGVTAALTAAVVPAALVLGLAIAALRDLRVPILNAMLVAYVDVLRALPPLVLMIYLYSGLPFLGVRLDAFQTVVLALVANGAAFFGEIIRAGLESVSRGQREAARATGLGVIATEIFIVIPQGMKRVVPPIASNVIELTKATALGSVLALPELLRSARMGQSIVYDATPLVMAAGIYLAFLWPAVRLLSRLEHRMTTSHGR